MTQVIHYRRDGRVIVTELPDGPVREPAPTAERVIKALAALTGKSEEEARLAWRAAADAEIAGTR